MSDKNQKQVTSIKQQQEQDSYVYDLKPSKLQRTNNAKHKNKQLKQYIRLLKWQQTSKNQMQYITKFNFKKTTAFKRKYSCHGYGGKCGMCKPDGRNQQKQYFKEDIVYGDSRLSVCFQQKVNGY